MLPSLPELRDVIFDEDSCIRFLNEHHVFYEVLSCPSCADQMSVGNDGRFRCRRRNCGVNRSKRIHTFFYGSRLSCSMIMHLAYHWLNKSTQTQTMNATGCTSKTVTAFYSHFRSLVSTMLDEDNSKIGGEGIIVEIDETKMGKRKYHRGHRVDGVWLLVGVELTEQRRSFVRRVETRDATTLETIIAQYVLDGSIIHTDMWRGYSGLESLGYNHRTVNHSLFFKDPVTGVHTNTVEGMNNALKIAIRPRNRTRSIDKFLSEFMWRRSNSNDLWGAFVSALREVHYDME